MGPSETLDLWTFREEWTYGTNSDSECGDIPFNDHTSEQLTQECAKIHGESDEKVGGDDENDAVDCEDGQEREDLRDVVRRDRIDAIVVFADQRGVVGRHEGLDSEDRRVRQFGDVVEQGTFVAGESVLEHGISECRLGYCTWSTSNR